MKHYLVSRTKEGVFRYQAWPTLSKGEDGTLYAAASGHRLGHICPFGKNLLYRSFDEGESWLGPQIVNDTYLDDRDAGLLALPNNTLFLTWFNHSHKKFELWAQQDKPHVFAKDPLSLGIRALWETLPEKDLSCGSFTKVSRDGGKSWSEKRPAPVSSPHGPCVLADGSLLYVGTQMGEKKEYDSDSLETRVQAHISHDLGETWEFLSFLPLPEGANERVAEPHAALLQNGDIIAAVRYQPKTGPSAPHLRTYYTLSHDGGKTWEEARFLPVHGAPPHLLSHSSGAVILTFSRRCEPMGEYVTVSFDFGKTWTEEKMIAPARAGDWDHGYPSTVELANGDLYTLYYKKGEGDPFTSLFGVRFSLDELK